MKDLFDLFLPVSVFSLVSFMLLGPLYIHRPYLLFIATAFTFLFLLELFHLFKFSRTDRNIRETLQTDTTTHFQAPLNKHAFILPNYKEPVSLLQNTISALACHAHAASSYILVLAMEETERECLFKAEALQEEFRSRFLDIFICVHPSNIAGEARGKGSNVNYAARKALAYCRSKGISSDELFFTVMDSDAVIPEIYVRQLEEKILRHGRNAHAVPAIVRVIDTMWSVMVMQNMGGIRKLSFPCSNYTMCASLAERVGFWDTYFEAIGEDMHMMIKAFFKTEGVVRVVPIYVPINLTNVQSDSYLSTVQARFTQGKRHFYGCSDVGFTLRLAWKPLSNLQLVFDSLWICFMVLETHFISCISGYFFFLALPVLKFCLPPLSPFYELVYSIAKIMSVMSSIPLILTYVKYHFLHLFIDDHLTKTGSRRWYHISDVFWLPLSGILYMMIPSTLATIRSLKVRRDEEYVVSEKLISSF